MQGLNNTMGFGFKTARPRTPPPPGPAPHAMSGAAPCASPSSVLAGPPASPPSAAVASQETWERQRARLEGGLSRPTTAAAGVGAGAAVVSGDGAGGGRTGGGGMLAEVLVFIEGAAARDHGSGACEADAGVHEALRLLHMCWNFSGAPRDVFEPVRSLRPLAAELLLHYGGFALSGDGRYIALRPGEEQLTRVGALMAALERYRRLPGPGPTSAAAAARVNGIAPLGASLSPCGSTNGVGSGAAAVTAPAAPPADARPISRLLLLNCESFGWQDSLGAASYDAHQVALLHTESLLRTALDDARYQGLGRPLASPPAAPAGPGGDAHTVLLLSDAILMEGGVPSLSLSRRSALFTAHVRYGRGLACLVPRRSPWAPPPPGGGGAHARPGPRAAAAAAAALTSAAPRLPPLSCGWRAACGVGAQAVLLAPEGPLVLHAEVEAEAAARGARAAVSERAVELAAWAAALLTAAPQPLLLVEWRVRGGASQGAASGGHSGGARPPAPPPPPPPPSPSLRDFALLELLARCEAHLSPPVRRALPAVLASLAPCHLSPGPDSGVGDGGFGSARPLLAVRGLEVAPEGEWHATQSKMLSSVQFRFSHHHYHY